MPFPSIAENLARLEDQIAAACRRAGRPRGEVALMAVSKMHPPSALAEAAAAGLSLFGENRVQEFQQKSPQLAGLGITIALDSDRSPSPTTIQCHLIGHLQSNKTTKAAEIFSAIDTLDSLRLAERLNEAAATQLRVLPVLLEIKLSPEESKTGLHPLDLPPLLERLPDLRNLKLRGLMTVPPWSEDAETARPYFIQLREIRDRLAAQYPRLDFRELSLGMSGDFAVAIEEGSTCIRIGTALFGKRRYPARPGADS
jgi:pyridoxal phosphate enzyme (YggS family)